MEIDAANANEEFHPASLNPKVNSVCHCTHLRLKEPLQLDKLRELLKRVRSSVPGLIEIHFGENVKYSASRTDSTDGNTHALFSRHQNGHYLKMYHTHPARVDLMNYLMSKAERPATEVNFVNITSSL
ncbi:hypothetical protein LSCM1_03418 [Leishmania martiniquensis]|uniref:Stress-response A/B barrel domain-containing protein n=1 Tax=Leishmania martiniquensis TaxID=1580590 RepID=A0A836H0H1_9TRYP|nr:hypothetical protein LSCM1_03418 [Leishmania martiniquensis]